VNGVRVTADGASSTAKGLRAVALLVALPGAPVVLASILGFDAMAAPWMLGSIVGLIGAMTSARLAVALSVIAGAASVVGALLHPYPVLGGLFMALLAGYAALTARRGVHSPVVMVALAVGFAVADPTLMLADVNDAANAFAAGAVVALGGLWAVCVWRVLARKVPKVPPSPFSAGIATIYAIVMATVMGVTTWAVLTWAPGHAGAWLLMSLIVVLQPDPDATLARSFGRMVGTVIGVFLAAVISYFVTSITLLLLVGLVLLFVSLALRFGGKGPYWVYVAFLTPAVVFFDSGSGGIPATEKARLWATLLAGAVAVVLAFAIRTIADRRASAGSTKGQVTA
jgi:hypothetical protein